MRFKNCLFAACVGAAMFCPFSNAQQPAASIASAVVPRLVSFSGRAVDGQGKIITGIAGATFAIYQDQFEGTPLWMETQNIQADAKGNYAVQLGAATPQGLPLELFSTGEGHWLGVRINGDNEQPRILLLSVPYALKAADAETIGGLPPSAFVLATTPNSAQANVVTENPVAAASPALAGTGTADYVPLWTPNGSTLGDSVIFQSGTGSTAKVGINTATPASTLDVKGGETVRGNLNLPATATATASAGTNSQPATFTASAFNSSTKAAVSQNFRWQAEPAGNDTSSPSATLNLLYGVGGNSVGETGLHIASNGQITFAEGQTFPGTSGGISGVTAGTDLTGGGTNGNVTLNLDLTKVPQLIANNIFTGNQGVVGSLNVTTTVSGGQAGLGNFSSFGTSDSNSVTISNGIGTTETFQAGCDGCFVPGTQAGDGGVRVKPGKNIFLGDSTASRLELDSSGNAYQALPANGIPKALFLYSPFSNGGDGSFLRCFNSTLSGAAATTPPCGFSVIEQFVGDYVFDLGFQIDDRILSSTPNGNAGNTFEDTYIVAVCTDVTGVAPNNTCNNPSSLNSHRVEVTSYFECNNACGGQGFEDSMISLIVY
jgi:hypothetical protein